MLYISPAQKMLLTLYRAKLNRQKHLIFYTPGFVTTIIVCAANSFSMTRWMALIVITRLWPALWEECFCVTFSVKALFNQLSIKQKLPLKIKRCEHHVDTLTTTLYLRARCPLILSTIGSNIFVPSQCIALCKPMCLMYFCLKSWAAFNTVWFIEIYYINNLCLQQVPFSRLLVWLDGNLQ